MKCAFSVLSVSRVNPTAIFVLVSLAVLVLNSIPTGDYLSDYFPISAYATKPKANPEGPTINDPNLVAQVVYKGLRSPTAMAFLDSDILVLEKDEGTVQRILDGKSYNNHYFKLM
jgi:glucose/arabinose dehydrogenase